MFRSLCLMAALVLPSLASAADEMVPLNFQPPESMKMFQQLRLTKAVGDVKGHDCAAALEAALADLDRVMGKAGMTDIAAIYTLNDREGWAPVNEVGCELKPKPDKVKKSIVKLEALVTMAGEGEAYGTISGVRATQMANTFVGNSTSMVALQFTGMRILEEQGKIWFVGNESHEEVFPDKKNRNTRAVTVFRDDVLPRLEYWLGKLSEIDEIDGIQFNVSAKRAERVDGEWKDVGETFLFFLPTGPMTEFLGGGLSEQEMLDSGFVQHQGKGPAVKIDISLIDAED